jgi:DNA gyrase subunit A
MVISITNSGYIKSLPLATYRQQRRGGVGIIGMDMKDDDYIEHLFVCSTHDYLLFFTNRGKVYRSKVYDLPEAGRTSKGRYLGNVLPLREGERVQSVLATRDFSESPYLMFATRNGTVKKTAFQAYNTPIKADGIIAINIRDDDELVAVRRVDAGDEILMVSQRGPRRALLGGGRRGDGPRHQRRARHGRLRHGQLRARDGRRAAGQDLLVVTENGFGKRTLVDEYRKTSRGAKGVKTIQQTEAKGRSPARSWCASTTSSCSSPRTAWSSASRCADFRPLGRNAQGFRLMNIREDDRVSAVALVMEEEASTAASAETLDPETVAGPADEPGLIEDADVLEEAGPADPTDEATITPPEVDATTSSP